MRRYLLLPVLLLLVMALRAQPGCTDPQALNFDPSATVNDGSCLYPETNYTLDLITELPASLIENSGLAVLPDGLLTHNDAGNPNELYRIDSLDGSVLQTILVVGENEDWEDLAESDTHIFVGDFGNNAGNRTDLKIYRIDKAGLVNNIVNAQPINFSFADQIDFSENPNNHDYDCEAFFFWNDSLHLFTKNWVDNQTRHYVIPAEPGFYPSPVRHAFNAGGLITGADISEDGTVALLGYTEDGFNFMWLLFDYPGNEFFSGNKRRIELGSGLTNSQTEGIAFRDNFVGYISAEQFDLGPVELPPKLMTFNIEPWVANPTSLLEMPVKTPPISLRPNPFFNELQMRFPDNWPDRDMVMRLVSATGQVILERTIRTTAAQVWTIDGLADYPAGVYFMQLSTNDFLWQARVVKH